MADALILRVGETKKISHIIEADSNFVISAATITIYDIAGNVELATTNATIESVTPATSQGVYYAWNTTGVDAGDYVYILKCTIGGQVEQIRGEINLLPVVSKYDRYIRRVESWVQETSMGEDLQILSYRDYMDNLNRAVEDFSKDHPRRLQDSYTLTSAFEYNLPSDEDDSSLNWQNDFSIIEEFEYPVDDNSQSKEYIDVDQLAVDEIRGKWRFKCISPSSGESARMTYRVRHTLNHTLDTLPASQFENVCEYAAGLALLKLANKAVQTSAPVIGADVVSWDTRQHQYLQQAKELMKHAKDSWGKASPAQANANRPNWTTWNYLRYHGKVRIW